MKILDNKEVINLNFNKSLLRKKRNKINLIKNFIGNLLAKLKKELKKQNFRINAQFPTVLVKSRI